MATPGSRRYKNPPPHHPQCPLVQSPSQASSSSPYQSREQGQLYDGALSLSKSKQPCKFGVKCRNKISCNFDHSDTLLSTPPHSPMSSGIRSFSPTTDSSSVPCKFGDSCGDPSICPYYHGTNSSARSHSSLSSTSVSGRHLDGQGSASPKVACRYGDSCRDKSKCPFDYSTSSSASSTPSSPMVAKIISSESPISLSPPTQAHGSPLHASSSSPSRSSPVPGFTQCSIGCEVYECQLAHPSGRRKLCRYGKNCAKFGCENRFLHPASRPTSCPDGLFCDNKADCDCEHSPPPKSKSSSSGYSSDQSDLPWYHMGRRSNL